MLRVVYQVYVVELSKKVFTENAKFRAANPQFNGVLECLYVGMTSKTPAERLQQHKTGYINKKGHKLSANIVEKYGIYLRPSLYNHLNLKPMNREEALVMEEKLAWHLRKHGMQYGLINVTLIIKSVGRHDSIYINTPYPDCINTKQPTNGLFEMYWDTEYCYLAAVLSINK